MRFLSVASATTGVRIVGEWDPLGMRGTDSRTLLFEDAFVPHDDELLPPGGYDQLSERWPYVYMTLTPTYVGLTRAVVDFVQGYLGGAAPPGIAARRDVPQKQSGWAQIQIMHERSRRALGGRRGRGRRRPDARRAAPRVGRALHGDGDGAGGRGARPSASAAARRC